ncbi:MAG: MCP four helix bundle domain-containing protein, partial [Candidatus Thermoplasmatota archaeon]|nr:MCP four helix bundle domain-containing protein [Candidatus Thermoplasmatota archaeon]
MLLIGIGVMGLASLSATNASLKTVYEDRVVALGQLERISALMNHSQIIVGESVSGQLSAFPEDTAVVDKRVSEIRNGITEIDAFWKAYMATYLTPEEKNLAKEFDVNRRKYGREGLLPALAALAAHDFQQAGEILQGPMRETYPPVRASAEALIALQLDVAKGEFEAAQTRF